MKKLEILTDPNPLLREKAEPVSSFDGEIQELIDSMIYTMRHADGVGLAAPQVGALKQIIVGEFESKDEPENAFPLTVVVNPKIIKTSPEQIFMLEGCLSFPGKELYIKRPEKIEVQAQDRWGKPIRLKCGNLISRVLQHESDHLNGILMIDHIKIVKTIFIGNGTLGIPTLRRISDDPQFKLIAVYTSDSKPAGRDRNLQATPVGEAVKSIKTKAFSVETIKNNQVISQIKNLAPELIILADYGEILPKEIIDIPKYGVLNIHPSLLPKYRGPSPIVSAILSGEKKTGVSIIKINEKIDSGDVLSQIEIKIKPRENTEQLKNRLANFAADLLAETVPYYLAGEISPIKQKEEQTTISRIIKKSNGKLTGNETAEQIDRMVRALSPWPGVYIKINGRKTFITRAHLNKEKKLVIDAVKSESKREMNYSEYLAGNKPLTF